MSDQPVGIDSMETLEELLAFSDRVQREILGIEKPQLPCFLPTTINQSVAASGGFLITVRKREEVTLKHVSTLEHLNDITTTYVGGNMVVAITPWGVLLLKSFNDDQREQIVKAIGARMTRIQPPGLLQDMVSDLFCEGDASPLIPGTQQNKAAWEKLMLARIKAIQRTAA